MQCSSQLAARRVVPTAEAEPNFLQGSTCRPWVGTEWNGWRTRLAVGVWMLPCGAWMGLTRAAAIAAESRPATDPAGTAQPVRSGTKLLVGPVPSVLPDRHPSSGTSQDHSLHPAGEAVRMEAAHGLVLLGWHLGPPALSDKVVGMAL